MRFTATTVLLASAGFAAAQSTSTDAAVDTTLTTSAAAAATATGTVSDSCDAANIVQTCLASTQTRVDACTQTDYKCLCAAYEAQLTCYDNCPNDNGRSTPQSYLTSYCGAASAQSSQSDSTKTSSGSSSSTSGASSSETSESASTTTDSSSSSATDSSSESAAAASSSSSGLATAVVVPAAGSMLALVMGIFGMM